MRVLLITPPMVQFNTAYPAVPVLAAFLREKGHDIAQEDLSLSLALRLFSNSGVTAVERALRRKFQGRRRPTSVRHFLVHAPRIRATVADAVLFLQGRAPELAAHFATPTSLPEGPRFAALRGLVDSEATDVVARHRASLFLDEIADAVREGIDDRFELARYAEHLAADAAGFDPLARALARRPTLLDRWIDDLAEATFAAHRPRIIGLTVPFPGALYGAFRIARRMKSLGPSVATVLGGGYVNTELRELGEPRVFDTFDYVSYDDGEVPLLRIIESLESLANPKSAHALVRTRIRRQGRVDMCDDAGAPPLRHRDRPAPDFSPLATAGYLAMAESPNPMHRLWTDRPWIKLMLAHGCYWHRCAFCDTSLDYIRGYDSANAATILGWMERATADTGLSGFHFVDEAAPPALLGNLSRLILQRGLRVQWWANIRFEKQYSRELAQLMARAGCLAMSGGLECAHDRLLGLMDKGITTAQATKAMRALSDAGILVHAYLMYGYPTQTAQETVDALEFVRGLFASGCLHSAYWHRFALTAHSPAFRDRSNLRLHILDPRETAFSRNEIPFDEPGRPDPGVLGEGLRRAVYNFMHGRGLEADVRSWFAFPVPRSSRRRQGRTSVS
jgi:Fe-S oxidoreductase